MGNVEPIREKLVVNILNRFLQSDNMPFPCSLLFDSALLFTPRSWIPVVDAQPFCTDERFGTVLSKQYS